MYLFGQKVDTSDPTINRMIEQAEYQRERDEDYQFDLYCQREHILPKKILHKINNIRFHGDITITPNNGSWARYYITEKTAPQLRAAAIEYAMKALFCDGDININGLHIWHYWEINKGTRLCYWKDGEKVFPKPLEVRKMMEEATNLKLTVSYI